MSSLTYGEELSIMDVYASGFLIDPSDKLTIGYPLESSDIDKNKNNDQRYISAKELTWRTFFGDVPMPTPKSDTAKRASGLLGRDIDLTDDVIEAGIAQLDR